MFSSHIEPLLQLIKEVNKSIIKIYKTSFEVEIKDDNSPLTQADIISHNIIKSFLNSHFPNIPVISEENEENEYDNYDTFFLLDPIDGTKEFVDKTDEFCICLALIQNQRPIFGLISTPTTGEILYAFKNQGVVILQNDKTSKLNTKTFEKNVLISKSHLDQQVLPFIEQNFPNHKILRKGSALKFCDITKGNADITLRFAPTYLWDTAAADILLEEVGKNIVNIHTNKKLIYSTKNLLNPGFKVI